MKKKFKSVVSIVLSIMMIISMVSVGFITTNAATTQYYINGAQVNSWGIPHKAMSPSNDGYSYYEANQDLTYFRLFKSSSDWNTSYGYTYVDNSKGTITIKSTKADKGDSDDNCYTTGTSGTYYIIVLHPNSTINKTSNPIIYASTKLPSSEPVAPDFYIEGRFRIKDASGNESAKLEWEGTSTAIHFESTANAGIYKLETNCTLSDLSENLQCTGYSQYQYFYVWDKNNKTYYSAINLNMQNSLNVSNAVTLNSCTFNSNNNWMQFSGTNPSVNNDAKITLWLDATGNDLKLYYTTDSATELTDGEVTLKDNTTINGSLSFEAEGKTSGTADVGDTVTITAKPFAGFTCSNITVSYTQTDDTAIEQPLTVSDNTATFSVPDVQANSKGKKSISFVATFTLDKASYLSTKGDGLWIDVAPDQADSTATLIKWNNYYSYKHNTSTNPYTFYVPKNVDLSNAKVYNGYSSSVTVNGTSISAKSFGTVNLSISGGSGTFNTSKGSLKVMQGSTNAMFLYTTKKGNETALRTETYADWNAPASSVSKADEKTDGGSCVTMTNDSSTAEFSSAMSLESVKGRGNSSWEASAKRFGKYAYNMKLSEKTTLFGMAKDTKGSKGSKSWCLLANNADESMLRNALAYGLAAEVGLYSSPEFSFVDIYDNGEYLGQYLITEKVDVGTSKLVYGESIEDINDDAGLVFDEDSRNVVNNARTSSGKTYSYCYTTETTGTPSPDISKATYLLEFEIEERYQDEACWFTTPQGQHVVVKTPEFATEEQVKFIAEKFIDMETEVFNNASNSILSSHLDLDSFARMYLIQEISSNLDSASTSYYVTYDCSKGDNARFVASPIWDYDWAFGQYQNLSKYDVSNNALDPTATNAWFAKNKKYDDSSRDRAGKYSIQSKLANNTSFQQVIKKVWDGTSTQEGFYAKVQKYFGNSSKIDNWYNQISASANMNETRWGFIKSDYISDWGSKNTGNTHLDAVSYLENTFLSPRATWLNNQFKSYPTYSQIATPTLKAYQADGKTELTEDVTLGDSIVLKAETTEIFVEYQLYKGNELVATNTTGVFNVTPDSTGIFNYSVKTVYNTSNIKTSNSVSVTIIGAKLTSVTLSVSATSITKGNSVTLTATLTPGDLTDCTYTFYRSNDNVVSDDDTVIASSTSNKATDTPTTVGDCYYYVKATKDGTEVTSSLVKVGVSEPQGTHTVRVWFKSASAIMYVPSVRLDNGSYKEMTKDEYIGSTYSGSLKFYWFYADIKIDSKTAHTLTFKTKNTSATATTERSNFNDGKYYFAMDNIVSGTQLVDLTSAPEYIKNYHRSATHMVSSEMVAGENSLGYTFINGREYAMGEIVNEETAKIQSDLRTQVLISRLTKAYAVSASSVGAGNAPFTIDSATLAQKCSADLADVSDLQMSLLDVNLDGKVDINDVTLMQKVLAQ